MTWIQRHWTLTSIFILAASLGWIVFSIPQRGQTTAGQTPAPREGFLAPDFELKNTQGEFVRLSDLRGRPVLVNLWASWCGPCKAEMPAMQKVYEAYAAQGFSILAVNTTFQDQKSNALDFSHSLGLTFPLLFDENGSVAQKYLLRAMPTSFFIDRQGIIRKAVFGGPMPEAQLRSEIEKLLAEKP